MFNNMLPTLTLLICCLLQFLQCQADQFNNELDSVLEQLKTEKLIHSGSATITRKSPCEQVSVSDVTVEKAISRLSKKFVEIDPSNKFQIAYCGADNSDKPATCAIDALCSTVYRWKKARTRSILFGSHKIFVEDKVLLPVSCMCVKGQADEKTGSLISTPIIIL